jgi:hypothetical protein
MRTTMRKGKDIGRRHDCLSEHQATWNTSPPTWDRTTTRRGRGGDDDAHDTRALHYEQMVIGRKASAYRGGMRMGG